MSRVFLVVGLGFGDEGKGTIVDYLARKHRAHTVVRFNGGAQAGHNVVTPEGVHHTFAQFGAGTLAGARTHLSCHMLVNPVTMMNEANHLVEIGISDPFSLVTISHAALVTNPYQMAANRLRELARGDARHGSCGLGIGETMEDNLHNGVMAIKMSDLKSPRLLREKLTYSRDLKRAQLQKLRGAIPESTISIREWGRIDDPAHLEWIMHQFERFMVHVRLVDDSYLSDLLTQDEAVIFEGAQGVLLDQDHGFHPYTTWSKCTLENADELIGRFPPDEYTRIGVIRGYMTRHGAGPLPTEDNNEHPGDKHNVYGEWQGAFRVGDFDAVMVTHAIDILGGVNQVAMTNMDRIGGSPRLCSFYELRDGSTLSRFSPFDKGITRQERKRAIAEQATPFYYGLHSKMNRHQFIDTVADRLSVPVKITSWGPTWKEKRER